MNHKYPERVESGIGPDGEFICIMGVETRDPELVPMEANPMYHDVPMVRLTKPKKIKASAHVWGGFIGALYLGMQLAKALIAALAVIAAATVVGALVFYVASAGWKDWG